MTRQSFYPQATPENPFGPTTAERMSQYAEHAGPLAAKSAQLAIDRLPLQTSQITHLVTVSCTGFVSPGIDHQLIQTLSLPQPYSELTSALWGAMAQLTDCERQSRLRNPILTP